jgi:hypothetical protein
MTSRLIPYVVASCAALVVATVLPIVGYAAVAIRANDPGGPLNWVLIPVGGAVVGAVVVVALCLVEPFASRIRGGTVILAIAFAALAFVVVDAVADGRSSEAITEGLSASAAVWSGMVAGAFVATRTATSTLLSSRRS